MEVADKTFEDIGEAEVGALRVDADGVLCDVVDREIFHGRDSCSSWIHAGFVTDRLSSKLI